MKEKFNQLRVMEGEIYNLVAASSLLGWDQQVNMPEGAAEDRGEQISTLETLVHQKATSDEMGRLLDDLDASVKSMDPDSDEACWVKVARRDYTKRTRVPSEHVAEMARVSTVAQSAWEKAKKENNFPLFEPHLEKLVALRRQYADFFAPYDHVYDPLLDDFEPGLKTAEVQQIFSDLKPQQVALIRSISQKEPVRDDFLHQKYDEKGQTEFGKEVISKFGYDWKRGRQDKSAHPFTTSFGLNDVRITTRFNDVFFNTAIFGTMHECGHALYEQNIDQKFNRTSLGDGASMAIHESQSRMWENLVGRSFAFWKGSYARLQEIFPTQLGDVDLETFYKGINKVETSLIRVEADEATYNLHIMLRLELEIALMEGSLVVADLPEAWNARMQEFLGVVPPDDEKGVLQDIHWSFGGFGYFPTYALGNLVAAQLWETLRKDITDLDTQIEKGKFDSLLAWLREKVHSLGAKFEPQELVHRITGSKINADAYMRILEEKFGSIYKL